MQTKFQAMERLAFIMCTMYSTLGEYAVCRRDVSVILYIWCLVFTHTPRLRIIKSVSILYYVSKKQMLLHKMYNVSRLNFYRR